MLLSGDISDEKTYCISTQVLHNGFELSRHFNLRDLEPDLGTDIIHLDLVNPAADQEAMHLNFVWQLWDDVDRAAFGAENTSEVKFYILHEGRGPVPHIVRCPVGNEIQGLELIPHPIPGEEGMEFRFGVCAASAVIKGVRKKKYLYHKYNFDVTPENARGCKITLRQNGNEMSETQVVLTPRGGEDIPLLPYTDPDAPLSYETERVRYQRFMRFSRWLVGLAINVGAGAAADAAADAAGDQLGGGDAAGRGVNVDFGMIQEE